MAPISINQLLTKTAALSAFRHPEWVDGGPGLPGPPQWSRALTSFAISAVVRDLAANLSDGGMAQELRAVARGMAEASAGGLVAGWDDGDDLCPPWRWPFPWPPEPGPWPWLDGLKVFGPLPDPWLDAAGPRIKDAMVGFAVAQLAVVTPDREFADQLQGMAGKLGA